VDFITNLFKKHSGSTFKKELTNILGFSPKTISLYKTALTHRSVREGADENKSGWYVGVPCCSGSGLSFQTLSI
jgi:hypothetical protein